MEYLLVIAMWAGTLSGGDSVALTSQFMRTESSCKLAGDAAVKAFTTMKKTVAYTCTPH